MCLGRIAEELFPFAYYLKNASRLKARYKLPELLLDEAFLGYDRLSSEELDRRLTEEHERAVALDDKTSKGTLFLSVAFSVLGLGLAAISSSKWVLAKTAFSPVGTTWLILLFGTSVVYFLMASWMALGALRTYQKFGFGTKYALALHDSDPTALRAEHLARQETVNNLRHCRNEAVFQAVRNGFILLFVGIVTILVAVYSV